MSSSTIETSRARSAGLNSDPWPAALARPIRRGIAEFVSRRRLHRHIGELMTLDDRTLRDIGLSRREVEHAAWHGWAFNCWNGRPLVDRR